MARAESGSITQLGKNRWRVRVSGGNDPVTGKRIRLTKVVHGTKRDAIAERTRMQVEAGQVDRAVKNMTVAQYFDQIYMPWYEENVRPSTYNGATYTLNKHIKPSIGHIELGKLSAYTVDTWLRTLEKDVLPGNVYSLLRSALQRAYKWGILPQNPLDKMDPPKRRIAPKTVASPELVTLLIDAVMGDTIEPIFLLEVGCGLRMSEALALDWEDIDFKAGKVRIHRTYQFVNGKGCIFQDVKTQGSARTVTVPKSILNRLLEIRLKDGVMRFGPLSDHSKDYGRLSPGCYRRRYKRICEEKLPDQPYITPKNLRHTHATILLRENVDLKTIADRLGHSSINITSRFYLQKVEELDNAASDVFDSAIAVAEPRPEAGSNVVSILPAMEA